MKDTRQAATRLTLDLALPDVQKSVSVTKGDINRRFEITLTNGGTPFPLPAKWSVILTGVKPDGSTLCNSCVVDGGRILYDFAAGHEIATCAGCFPVTFIIYDEVGDPLYTPELWLHVAEDESMELASASQATTVDDMLRRVKDMEASVDDCEAEVLRMDGIIRTSLKGDKGEKGDRGDPGPAGPQGVQGERGEPFAVARVYPSVAAMEAGYATDGVSVGAFVVIDTGSADDEENARVYMKGMTAYEYLTDLSGARGMQGPQGVQGLQGVAGKTAYQYAVEGGFVGSEADWQAQLMRALEVGEAKEIPNADVAYSKNVPATSAPYAKVMEIGGMTYKEGETLRSAPVTEVESVGVNLFDKSKVVIGRGIGNEGIPYNWDGGFYSAPIAVIEGKTYAFAAIAWHNFFSDDGAPSLNNAVGIASSGTFAKIPSGAKFVRISASVANIDLAMVNEGTTALPYTPYVKHTLPIPAAVQALDGYGWSVSDTCYNYIDWEKKQFVKRVGCVDMGTLTWIQNVTSQFYAELPNRGAQYSMNSLCSKYEASATGAYYNAVDKSVSLVGNNAWLQDTSYTDATAFKAAMAGVMLYYELAEPVVTDISDLLPADSYIGVEGGGTVTMVSEYGYDVPSKVVFFEGSSRAIGAETFVGDLAGVAARAEADGEGNRISDTYVTRAELESRLLALEAALATLPST